MIQAATALQALYYARQGYLPCQRPYERKTYIAKPDEGYRGGIASTTDRGIQI